MVSREEILAACDDIVREFEPLQIILYGSYAYGTPSKNSDVDLLVVMPVDKSEVRDREVEIKEQIPSRFNIDLLVRSPEYIAYRLSYNDWFFREVTEKGQVLYETDGFYIIPPKIENTEISPITIEWIEKAEGDYSVAAENYRGQNPVYHVICFLAQQCVEKYLKAWLQENNIPIQRTHNLNDLLDLILPTMPAWRVWQNDLSTLTKHAVDSRYPEEIATESDAENAMRICGELREAVRTALMLPSASTKGENR